MAMSLLGRCARVVRVLLAGCRLAWLAAGAWMRGALGMGALGMGARVAPDDGPSVYRVYVFNCSTGDDCPGGFFREISPRYFNQDTWEEDAARVTGWPDFRVEVRYTLRRKKHRMVLHRGDVCSLPSGPPACRLPKGVLSARLQGPLGSDVDVDVTSRVIKYQGPRGDFHAGAGLHVRLHEMFPFPFDDGGDERFTHLRIVDVMAQMHDLPYSDNPVVRLG